MKIALLSYEYPPDTGWSDVASYTFYQAQALTRLGHQVTVFAGADQPGHRVVWDDRVELHRAKKNGPFQRLARDLEGLGLPSLGVRIGTGADLVMTLRRQLRRAPFDLIEVSASGGEAPMLAVGHRVPTVVRLHQSMRSTTAETKTMDRLSARTLDRLGISAARAVSASSRWLLQRTSQRIELQCPAQVIPYGIDVTSLDRDPETALDQRFELPSGQPLLVFARGIDHAVDRALVERLCVVLLRKHPDLHVILTHPLADAIAQAVRGAADGAAARIHGRSALAPWEYRAVVRGSAIYVDPVPQQSGSFGCLEAMAMRRAIVAADSGGIPELIQSEIEGLLAVPGDVDSFASGISRLLRDGDLRREFGDRARRRVEQDFTADATAQRSVEFYGYALGITPATQPRTSDARHLLGPDNWFDAWWLQRSARSAPGLAADADGVPMLAKVSLDEICVVEGILARAWNEEHRDWSCPEAAFLRDLRQLYLDAAVASRDREDSTTAATATLTLPSLQHPMFEGGRARWFVEAMWRVESMPAVADWLERETTTEHFLEAAHRDPWLRILLVKACENSPSPRIYEAARRLYRSTDFRDAVVHDDLAFFDRHEMGTHFRAAIERLGLHAPLRRPAIYPRRRKKAAAPPAPPPSEPPVVTVLIPSYRHQKYIERAIRSVLDQTHTDLHVLVVDDNSPDRTVQAARRIDDPRVTVRRRDHNVGLGNSIIEALADIESPYVALLNSDDLFHPERLQHCLEALDSDPDAQLVATDLDFIDRGNKRLTRDTSCIVDVGPQTHQWLQWYDRVCRELDTPKDRVSPAALLRHNHLATSSNMVFRTAYLEQCMGQARELKFCVDWLLFLFGAIDGVLRFVPKPLLAYRFHDSNTVWFKEGGRSDYVIEVNDVVRRAMRRLVDKVAAAHGPAAARAQLAELLGDHVQRHGETDGLGLFFAELTDHLQPGEPSAAETAAVEHLVDDIFDRKTMLEAMRRIDLPPWSVVGIANQARRLQIDSHVAEGFFQRSNALAHELEQLRRDVEDRHRLLVEQREVTERLRADLGAARRDTDGLRRARRDAETKVTELGLELRRSQQEHEAARREFDRLAVHSDELARKLQDLRRDAEALRAERAELTEAAAALRQHRDRLDATNTRVQRELDGLRDQTARITAERDELRRTITEVTEVVQQLDREHGEARDTILLLRQLADESRARAAAVEQSLEHRTGRAVLQTMRLRKPCELALRARAQLSHRAGWLGAQLGRRLTASGRNRTQVLVPTGEPFPSASETRLAAETAGLVEAGFDVRVLAFGRGPAGLLGAADRRLSRRRRVLHADAAVARASAKYFTRHRPDQVRNLTAAWHAHPETLAKLFHLAYAAKPRGLGYVHGIGLGESGLLAHGVWALLGVPYGVTVGGTDLPMAVGETELVLQLLTDATLVVTDCEKTADSLHGIFAGALRPTIVPPTVRYARDPDAGPNNGALRAVVTASPNAADLLPLADAVSAIVNRGTDIVVDLLDRAQPANSGALDLLRLRFRERGIADRFAVHSEGPHVAAALARASALVVTSRIDGQHDSTGIPAEVLAAMANGVPIIATKGSALDGLVRDHEDGLLVPAGDAQALAEVLQTLARDPELRRTLGSGARARVENRGRDGAAAMYAAIRRLLGQAE